MLKGPTSESTKDTMSLRASSTWEAYWARGDRGLSVMATVVAFWEEAYFMVFTAFLEYRGKLMAITASPSPTWTICCKMVASLVASTRWTVSNTRRR